MVYGGSMKDFKWVPSHETNVQETWKKHGWQPIGEKSEHLQKTKRSEKKVSQQNN